MSISDLRIFPQQMFCSIFGMDCNAVLDLSKDAQQALSVRPKKRDRSFTECIDVREWLIDTGCGRDLPPSMRLHRT
ncbi:MAG: hypothetical protein ACKPKO_06960, partial [Candidatus Fonsibacter sp.]